MQNKENKKVNIIDPNTNNSYKTQGFFTPIEVNPYNTMGDETLLARECPQSVNASIGIITKLCKDIAEQC